MPYRRTLAALVVALGAASPAAAQARATLVRPHDVVRSVAPDAPGVALAYRAADVTAPLSLEVLDPRGRLLISWGGRDGAPMPASALDSVVWNLRYPGVPGADGEWVPGPLAPPGRYLVRLRAGASVDTTTLVVRADPRAVATRMDYGEQLAFLLHVRNRLAESAATLRASRALRAEVAARRDSVPDAMRARFDMIDSVLAVRSEEVESQLRRRDDGVSARLAALLAEAGVADGHPTDAQYSAFMTEQLRLDTAVLRLKGTYAKLLPYMNATLAQAGLEPVGPGAALATR